MEENTTVEVETENTEETDASYLTPDERLAISRRHADDGRLMSADQISANVRKKYGL